MKTRSSRNTSATARPPRLLWLIGIAVAQVLTLGAGPPDVVRVRVPSEKVQAWFPPGTEIRGLGLDEFESLLVAARSGAARQPRLGPPRILQARHFARWEAGLLIGRSELVIEPSGPEPSEVVLEPWAQALDPAAGDSAPLRVRDSGRTAVRVHSSAQTTLTLSWQLRARPNSMGRGFTLGLPATETAILTLDLPERWVPEGIAGLCEGPLPGPKADRSLWRFIGRGGLMDLRIHHPDVRDASHPGSSLWVSGPTRIDLADSRSKPNWRTEWSVDAGPHDPRRLLVELDPGLELVAVSGPAVEAYLRETRGPKTWVTVHLTRDASGPTPITITAHARVPSAGPWLVPAARPLDALWTGGTTTIRLDPSRVLQDCHERAGRRVLPRLSEPTDPNLLVFEARAPEPVAELVFRAPWSDVSAEVRGQLILGGATPRIRCRLPWKAYRGRLLDFDLELPPGWVLDQVQIEGINESVEWHPDIQPDGRVRARVVPPTLDDSKKPLVLNLAATATVGGGRGPLALPRVRPVGIRVAEELWVAWTDPALTLQPTVARGLAWIDPKLVTESPSHDPIIPPGLHETLAWRWLAEDAEARVERVRDEASPGGAVHLVAQVDPDRLRLDGRLTIDAGEETLRSVFLASTEPSGGALSWRFTDESTGLEVPRQPLDDRQRIALGLPENGEAWELNLPQPRPGKVVLRARVDSPWVGEGRLPFLTLPGRFQGQGVISVAVARGLNSSVRASGLKTLDPVVTTRFLTTTNLSPGLDLTMYRSAYAFGYTARGGRLELRTERLNPAPIDGVIREAVLTTFWSAPGASRHHLSLRVAADQAQALSLSLPQGSTLIQARRDRQPIIPTQTAEGLAIALPDPKALRGNCTITLDYASPRSQPTDASKLGPELPATAFPCLAFTWQVVAPEPWVVTGAGPQLVATDPSPLPSWFRRMADSWRGVGDTLRASRAMTREAAMIRALDERVAAIPSGEMTLGEWLTRWDSGPWPIVIDRLALASAGWGPKSRIVTPRIDLKRAGAALSALRSLGLAAVPLGGSVLITTRPEAPDRTGGPIEPSEARAAWEAILRQASAWGSDVSDRFESVTRWRGEPTPRSMVLGEAPGEGSASAGWRVWRFTAPGWPAPGAEVLRVDQRARSAWAWTVGLAILALGIAVRRAPARPRFLGLAVVVAVGLGVTCFGPVSVTELASRGVLGALAVLCFWLGRSISLPSRPRVRSHRSPSSLQRRAGGSGVTFTMLAGLALVAHGAWITSPPPDRDDRILALLPYDGVPDPNREPDRVILRLRDFDRLKALAERGDAPTPLELSATAAVHSLSWEDDRAVVVESEYTLVGPGAGPIAWSFPLDNAREVSALLDGTSVPVFVQPGGRTATVSVTGSGTHQLRLRRIALPRPGEGGEVLSLPIDPVATARIVVENDQERRPIEVLSARGRVEPTKTGVAGWLGPADRLEVRWSSPTPTSSPTTSPLQAVEGVLLWDAEPAGDRVRARLTYRNPLGTSLLRIRVEPGLVVRARSIPGRVDATWQGTAERPEWVASVDPPLPDGTTIGLEFWRPAPRQSTSARQSTSEGTPVRSLPLIDPQGVRRFSGALAFRRPSDWFGRLPALAGTEVITEESFVKLWGNLPENPLTLSGVTRFGGSPNLSLPTGPIPRQLSVQPSVQLRVESGRIDLEVKADLTEVSGGADRLEFEMPDGLRLISVEADGLTDWSHSGPRRILLRFDGAPARQRSVRVQGWIPVTSNPLATGPTNQEISVPWLRWFGADTKPTILNVAAPIPCQLNQAPGVTQISTELAGATPAPGPQYRLSYRVESPENLGKLRWVVESPRVGVLVQSQLTVNPESTEWVALLRYDVSGGALDAFHLKLPTTWAAQAEVTMVETGHQLTSEARGESTYWTIRPDHPAWGSQRLVVRASRPSSQRELLAFPDLVPLGRGEAETDLAIVNGTGRELGTVESSGLQPIDYATRFRDELFVGAPGAPTGAYRVRKEDWSLKVQVLSGGEPAHSDDRKARVSLADLQCTITPDGSVIGMVQYEVEPRSGVFLPVELPGRCQPLWAAVNNVSTRPLRSPTGRLLIPLDEETASHVLLVWRATAEVRPGAERSLTLPNLEPARVPTLLTVLAPETVRINNPGGTFEAVGLDQIEFERAEWLSRRLVGTLGKVDRSSLREREALVSHLVMFDLFLRSAERSIIWNLTGSSSSREERIRRARERAKAAQSSLAEPLRSAGFDEFLEAARVHLGLVAENPGTPPRELPEPAAPVRPRRIGRPRAFEGESGGSRQPIALAWSPAPSRSVLERKEVGAWLLVAAAVVFVVLVLERRVRSPHRRVTTALLLALAASAVGGPWTLAMSLGMAVLGWRTRSG